jgi:hypothetical protein
MESTNKGIICLKNGMKHLGSAGELNIPQADGLQKTSFLKYLGTHVGVHVMHCLLLVHLFHFAHSWNGFELTLTCSMMGSNGFVPQLLPQF